MGGVGAKLNAVVGCPVVPLVVVGFPVTAELPSGVGAKVLLDRVGLLVRVLFCSGVGLGETLDAPEVGLLVCWPFVVVRKVGTGVTRPTAVGEDVGMGVAGDLV